MSTPQYLPLIMGGRPTKFDDPIRKSRDIANIKKLKGGFYATPFITLFTLLKRRATHLKCCGNTTVS